jgi:hypothetical protein
MIPTLANWIPNGGVVMSITFQKTGLRLLPFFCASALGFAGSLAQGAIFEFSYSLPPLLSGPDPLGVTANGIFTTSAFDGTDYTITSITGFRNGEAITALLAPGAFSGNDNLLFPSAPFVDGNGVSFTVAGSGDDGTGDVNLFFDGSGYTENSFNIGDGTLSVTNSVPEPWTLALTAGGLLALMYLRRSWFGFLL